ncbi:MAG: flagellar hook-length control protein FliK, partial [Planctomycetota bacterium]
VQVNIKPDIPLEVQASENVNSLALSSENAQLVALATENTQAEQIQNQPLSAQDVVSQPNVADQIIPAPQNEQTENIQQQPVAQITVDNGQSQQTPHNTQEISIPLELEAQTQQNGQLSVENNVAAVNTDQSLAQQPSQDNSVSIQKNLNPSQAIPQQLVSENNTDTAGPQTQTQQDTNNKLTVNALVEENGGEQLNVTNVQTINSSVQNVGTNIEAASQQMVNTATEQNQGVVTSSLTQETENSEASGLLNTASAAVGRQIQESIQSSFANEQQQITINLQPPELGKVTIKFEQQGDDITGQLEVTKAETRSQITEQLPEIIRNLAEAGIQIKKIDVNLAEQYEQDNYKEQSSQDMFLTDQQYQSQQQPDNNETPQQLTTAEQLFQADFQSQPQQLDHEGSLNMLV